MLKEAGGIRRVVLKTGRTDLRRGIDGLKAVISLNGMDPLEKGTLFLFCGRRNDRIRGLTFEGLSAGFCYPHIFRRWLIRTGDFKRIHKKHADNNPM
jgi:transposase